jgi:hypothetical protein
MRSDLTAGGVAYICSFECTYCANCVEQMNAVCPNCAANSRDRRAVKTALLRAPPPVLDSIGQETLLADNAHVDQRTMHTGGQKFPAQAG